MVRETDVENVDGRSWQVATCADDVDGATFDVRQALDMLNQPVTRQQLDELDSVRISCALEHKWVDAGRKSIQNV